MHRQTYQRVRSVDGVVGADRMIGLMAIAANLCVWAVLLPTQTAMAL